MSTAVTNPRFKANMLKRQRELITPEGLALPLTIASKGSRAGALLLDLVFINVAVTILVILFLIIGVSLLDFDNLETASPALEFVIVLAIMTVFLSRYGYFLWFELGAKGATPGKRIMGIRVAARDGGRLTSEAVIARNLIRDIEVFIPMYFLLGGGPSSSGVFGVATFIWLAVFVLFPFFNKDALRAGDLVAGTWVVESRKEKLPEVMSLAPDRSSTYSFGDAELSVYGEHELQVLEQVLRQDNIEAMREVVEAICRKIGWQAGAGDEREFLETFYGALRGHLEGRMRFGKRKANKFATD